jgi:hypothetical protein
MALNIGVGITANAWERCTGNSTIVGRLRPGRALIIITVGKCCTITVRNSFTHLVSIMEEGHRAEVHVTNDTLEPIEGKTDNRLDGFKGTHVRRKADSGID